MWNDPQSICSSLHAGTLSVFGATCLLVEVTFENKVYAGYQDPCSNEVVSEGSSVQAAGNSIFQKLANYPELVDSAWIAVENVYLS